MEEIVDAFAQDAAELIANLALQAQGGEREACITTMNALAASYGDLGLDFATQGCAAYIANLSDSRRPMDAPPANLAVDLRTALAAIRHILRDHTNVGRAAGARLDMPNDDSPQHPNWRHAA
jgi:hypothetical protein